MAGRSRQGLTDVAIEEREPGRWVATGQTQEYEPHGDCWPEGYTGCLHPEGVFIDDEPLWQVGSRANLEPGTFFFNYAHGIISGGGDLFDRNRYRILDGGDLVRWVWDQGGTDGEHTFESFQALGYEKNGTLSFD